MFNKGHQIMQSVSYALKTYRIESMTNKCISIIVKSSYLLLFFVNNQVLIHENKVNKETNKELLNIF